jgi:hypothetical protein
MPKVMKIALLAWAAAWVFAGVAIVAVVGPSAEARPAEAARHRTSCVEDAPCWSWSQMGNRRRGIVTAWGTPKVVGPCGYRREVLRTPPSMRKLLGRKLKGDRWALRHGCDR